MLKVIGFDADETLWPTQQLYETAFDAYTEALDTPVNHETLFAVHSQTTKTYGDGAMPLMRTLLTHASGVLDDQSDRWRRVVEDVINVCSTIHNTPVHPYDGVKETLEWLRSQNLQCVMVTCGSHHEQLTKLERSGLSELFSAAVVVTRKDKAQYQSLLGSLGINPDEFLMVGDTPHQDIDPVIAAGGHAVLIAATPTNGSGGGHVVSSLTDLVDVVSTLTTQPDSTTVADTAREGAAAVESDTNPPDSEPDGVEGTHTPAEPATTDDSEPDGVAGTHTPAEPATTDDSEPDGVEGTHTPAEPADSTEGDSDGVEVDTVDHNVEVETVEQPSAHTNEQPTAPSPDNNAEDLSHPALKPASQLRRPPTNAAVDPNTVGAANTIEGRWYRTKKTEGFSVRLVGRFDIGTRLDVVVIRQDGTRLSKHVEVVGHIAADSVAHVVNEHGEAAEVPQPERTQKQ